MYLIVNSLRFLAEDGNIYLYGFVIVDNHIHAVWQLLEGHSRQPTLARACSQAFAGMGARAEYQARARHNNSFAACSREESYGTGWSRRRIECEGSAGFPPWEAEAIPWLISVSDITGGRCSKRRKRREANNGEIQQSMSKNSLYILAGIAILIVSGYFINQQENKQILGHAKHTQAHVESVFNQVRPTVTAIKYYYTVKDDTFRYQFNVESRVDLEKLKSLEGKLVPVVYDSIRPQVSRLLINLDKYE